MLSNIYFVVLYFTLSSMYWKELFHVDPLGCIWLLNTYSVLIQTEGSKLHTADLKAVWSEYHTDDAVTVRTSRGHTVCLWFLVCVCSRSFLVHRLETVCQNHISRNSTVPPSRWMCPGESYIWKMTPANNLSSCADWCAQLTFFFSAIAELQLSVGWPNPIEAPYGQSNVIFQAFILCLQLDREGPRRDGIWIGDGCLRAAIEQEEEAHNVCDRDSSKPW